MTEHRGRRASRPFPPLTGLTPTLLLVAGLGVAHAGTVVVSPGGSIQTIQDGVDAAGPGDTVLVKKGVYQETVSIPTGKTGLTLRAAGKVTIDARKPGGAPAGTAVTVQAEGVTIRGFSIRHAALDLTPGYGVDLQAASGRVVKCTFVNTSDDAVHVGADGAEIENVAAVGCGTAVAGAGQGVQVVGLRALRCGNGVRITGDGVVVKRCRLENIDSQPIDITGDDAIVVKNRCLSSGSGAIEIDGGAARVEKNRIESTDDVGVFVTGDAARVAANRIRRTGDRAIRVDGDNAEIVKNRVRAADEGVRVKGDGAMVLGNRVIDTLFDESIEVDGSAPVIADNVVRGTASSRMGLFVTDGVGGAVTGNAVRFVTDAGIYVDGSSNGIELSKNRVIGSCPGGEPGIVVRAPNAMVAKNRSIKNGGDGIHVTGDQIELVKNRAASNAIDGIDVESGDAVRLIGNKALKNGAEGIENNGTNAVVEKNRSKKNRTDFANSGTVASFVKNKIADGSDVNTQPEVD